MNARLSNKRQVFRRTRRAWSVVLPVIPRVHELEWYKTDHTHIASGLNKNRLVAWPDAHCVVRAKATGRISMKQTSEVTYDCIY
jgi:hypothetical protein